MLRQLSALSVLAAAGLAGCTMPGGEGSGSQEILCPASGCAPQSRPSGEARALLKTAGEIALGRGFRRTRVTKSGSLESGQSEAFPVRLEAGEKYLAVGLCEEACLDLDLAFYNEQDFEVASDTLEDDIPIIEFSPEVGGSYILRTEMIRCDMEPCRFGVGVYRQ